MLKEKEARQQSEKEKEQAQNRKELERHNTVCMLNKDILYTKDLIQSVEETIREANEEIAKALKGTFRKEDIQKSHTIIQMSFDRKRNLESTLSELEIKRKKLDK